MNRNAKLLTLVFLLKMGGVNSQTTLLWSESAGTSATSQKSFITTDLIGNIYMASSVNGTYGLDWKISSWRPDSVSRWTYTYNGAGNEDDIPAAIVVDSAFNIYVAGTIKSSGSNDIRVIKLDSAGNLKWGTNYNRTGSAHDVGTGLAVVGDKLWVSGHSQQSTSNYDYTLLKYDTAGTLSWSRHRDGSASGDDYSTALAVGTNGNAYLTGNGVVVGTGNIRDVMTVRYTTDGTLSWTNYYGGTSGQHDYGNDVKIDASGNILVTGQTFIGSSNSDLVLIKYSSGGSQSWVATYSGASKKHDAGRALVVGSDGYYYVTGFMQTGGGTNNYVTVRYNSSGTVSWAQTYDGPGASDDEACAIIEDGSDIVITGKSTGSGTGLDVCTISMVKSSGSVNWTSRIHESGSTGDFGLSLCTDVMGNILVTGLADMSSTSKVNVVYKLNQLAKNNAAIQADMYTLAYGLLAIRHDTIAKRILYDYYKGCLDSTWYIGYAKYLTVASSAGHAMKNKMNDSIEFHTTLDNYDCIDILSKRLYYKNTKYYPGIFMSNWHLFSRTTFISSTAHCATQYRETTYPLPCVTTSSKTIDAATINSTPTIMAVTWFGFTMGRPGYGQGICDCAAYIDPQDACWVCSPTALGPLPLLNVTTGTGDHEVSLHMGIHDPVGIGDWPLDQGHNFCMNVVDASGSPSPSQNFAVLSGIPGYFYYERIPYSISHMAVKKVLPIANRSTGVFANRMTLCGSKYDFNDYGENDLPLALGMGGVFYLHRPGQNMNAVYFSYPFSEHLWWTGGPDLNLAYGVEDQGQNPTTCTNGLLELVDYMGIGPQTYLGNGQYMYGLSSYNERNIIASTDYTAISAFWSDNVVTVGLNTDNASNTTCKGNVFTFYASTTPPTCNPAVAYPTRIALSSCTLSSSGEYEVVEDLATALAVGDVVVIHVRANFFNGESIDECIEATVNANPDFTGDMTGVSIDFRGGIKDYSSTVNNYQVDVYKIPQ